MSEAPKDTRTYEDLVVENRILNAYIQRLLTVDSPEMVKNLKIQLGRSERIRYKLNDRMAKMAKREKDYKTALKVMASCGEIAMDALTIEVISDL